MKNVVNYLENPFKYKQELLRTFKRVSSSTIQETFLMNVFNKIEHGPRYSMIISTLSSDSLS